MRIVAPPPLLDRGQSIVCVLRGVHVVVLPLSDRGAQHLDGGETLNPCLTLHAGVKAQPVVQPSCDPTL